MNRLPLFTLLPVSLSAFALASASEDALRFDFGGTASSETAIVVEPAQAYDPEVGYGFEYGPALTQIDTPRGPAIASDGPFVFSVQLPEGNYDVAVTLAGNAAPQPVTIKTESRRLAVENLVPTANALATARFTVNIRSEKLAGGGKVALKEREIGAWHWDDRLQLEINGQQPVVAAIEITPNPRAPTLYLAGDSTVTDQREEPWIGWGQMLPRFFLPGVAVSNHAESGLAFSSFQAHRRLDKILETLKPGDYLLMQFGHNDMKEGGDGIGPWQSYTRYIEEFVAAARSKGAKPILITSMKRRRFDEQGRQFGTLQEYPHAVRQAAERLQVPLIDLNLMSGVLYGALGPEDSKKAFVHYPAGTFPGQDSPLKDDTHFNAYGGYQLARCVVEGLRLAAPELIPYLDPQVGRYDPTYPDPFDAIKTPPSPVGSFNKPDGD